MKSRPRLIWSAVLILVLSPEFQSIHASQQRQKKQDALEKLGLEYENLSSRHAWTGECSKAADLFQGSIERYHGKWTSCLRNKRVDQACICKERTTELYDEIKSALSSLQRDGDCKDASSSAALDQLMSFSSGFLSLANRLREQACQFKGSPLAETVADGAPRKDERIKKGRKPAQDDHNAAAEEDKHMASSKNGQAESIKHRPMTAMAKKPLPPEKCQPAGKALIHCLRQHNLRAATKQEIMQTIERPDLPAECKTSKDEFIACRDEAARQRNTSSAYTSSPNTASPPKSLHSVPVKPKPASKISLRFVAMPAPALPRSAPAAVQAITHSASNIAAMATAPHGSNSTKATAFKKQLLSDSVGPDRSQRKTSEDFGQSNECLAKAKTMMLCLQEHKMVCKTREACRQLLTMRSDEFPAECTASRKAYLRCHVNSIRSAVDMAGESVPTDATVPCPHQSATPLIVVPTMDGIVHGLLPADGRQIWSFDLGTPSIVWHSEQWLASKFVLVPSVQGVLYVMSAPADSDGEGELVHMVDVSELTYPEQESWHHASIGYAVSVKATSHQLIKLDAITGRPLSKQTYSSQQSVADAAVNASLVSAVCDRSKMILCGTSSYHIQVHEHEADKMVWNITWTSLYDPLAPRNADRSIFQDAAVGTNMQRRFFDNGTISPVMFARRHGMALIDWSTGNTVWNSDLGAPASAAAFGWSTREHIDADDGGLVRWDMYDHTRAQLVGFPARGYVLHEFRLQLYTRTDPAEPVDAPPPRWAKEQTHGVDGEYELDEMDSVVSWQYGRSPLDDADLSPSSCRESDGDACLVLDELRDERRARRGVHVVNSALKATRPPHVASAATRVQRNEDAGWRELLCSMIHEYSTLTKLTAPEYSTLTKLTAPEDLLLHQDCRTMAMELVRCLQTVDGFRIEDFRYLFESLQGLETVPDTCQPAKHRWYFNCHHLALISRSSIQNVNDKHAPLLHETIQTGLDDIAVGDQSAVPFIDAHSTAPRWAAVQTVFSVLWCLSVAFLLLWIVLKAIMMLLSADVMSWLARPRRNALIQTADIIFDLVTRILSRRSSKANIPSADARYTVPSVNSSSSTYNDCVGDCDGSQAAETDSAQHDAKERTATATYHHRADPSAKLPDQASQQTAHTIPPPDLREDVDDDDTDEQHKLSPTKAKRKKKRSGDELLAIAARISQALYSTHDLLGELPTLLRVSEAEGSTAPDRTAKQPFRPIQEWSDDPIEVRRSQCTVGLAAGVWSVRSWPRNAVELQHELCDLHQISLTDASISTLFEMLIEIKVSAYAVNLAHELQIPSDQLKAALQSSLSRLRSKPVADPPFKQLNSGLYVQLANCTWKLPTERRVVQELSALVTERCALAKPLSLGAEQVLDFDCYTKTSLACMSNIAKSRGWWPQITPPSHTLALQNKLHGLSTGLVIFDELLGSGTYGSQVHAAELHRRPVAIKRLSKKFDVYQLMRPELALLTSPTSSCRPVHPNLCQLFHVGETVDSYVVVMARCRHSLAQLIDDSNAWPDIRRVTDARNAIILGVIDGLSYLHDLGLVHADLKPSNILIGDRLEPRIVDMGLRRRLDSMSHCRFQTLTPGSLGWWPAEMCSGGMEATFAVDVFALGCLIHFVTFDGEHPFGDASQRELNIQCGNPLALEMRTKRLAPKDAVELIVKMVDVDASKRPELCGVRSHVFFWNQQQKQSFVAVVTDYIDASEQGHHLLTRLNQRSQHLIGRTGWVDALEPIIQDYLCKHRGYRSDSVQDLFRMLSSVHNSTRDLPAPCQRFLSEHGRGEGWEFGYFLQRLPGLLMELHSSVLSLKLQDYHPFKQFFLNT